MSNIGIPKSHSSSGSLLEPYQLGFTEGETKNLTQKQRFGNQAHETFQEIAKKRANRNGLELMTEKQFKQFKPISK